MIKAHMSSGEITGEQTFSNLFAELSVLKAQNGNSKYKMKNNSMINILHYYSFYHHHHHHRHHQLIQDKCDANKTE